MSQQSWCIIAPALFFAPLALAVAVDVARAAGYNIGAGLSSVDYADAMARIGEQEPIRNLPPLRAVNTETASPPKPGMVYDDNTQQWVEGDLSGYIDDPDAENDDWYQAFAGDAGRFIDNTTDSMTYGERRVVNDLVAQGKTVERVPKNYSSNDKSPDFIVDGVMTELKTLENANTNTGMKRIQEGFRQHAETVIIDARGSGLTNTQAIEIINRARGKYENGRLPGNIEIWIDGQVVTYP